jgi:hypothetical protein
VVPEASEERGLRVGLSALHRAATVQEFALRATVEGTVAWVEESRVAGVDDRRLQLFVKAAQGLLRTMKITTLDAAFLEGPAVEGGRPAVVAALRRVADGEPRGRVGDARRGAVEGPSR